MNGDKPRSFLPQSKAERLCPELRTYESSSPVKVYKANPDGTIGELLRIEEPRYYGDPRVFPKRADRIRGA